MPRRVQDTESRFEELGINMARIEEQQKAITKEITEFKESHKQDMSEIKTSVKEFIAAADAKYASKEVETFINKVKSSSSWVVAAILLAILGLVLSHVWPGFKLK